MHKNINLTDSGGVGRRVWELMEKDSTYVVAGMVVGGGKWYLRCLMSGMVFDGLYVWVEVGEKVFVLVPTF